MSVYHPNTVNCPCGKSFTHALVDSANVERSPAIRQAVLDGTLHRVYCPACGKKVVVETQFYFADPKRNSLFLVKPSNERFRSLDDSAELARGVKQFPSSIMDTRTTQLRVVYGLDELREKLLCQDFDIGDHLVEMAKLFVLRDHPFLMRQNRLVIHLTAVRHGSLHFIVGHKNQQDVYSTRLPLALLDELRFAETATGVPTRGTRSGAKNAKRQPSKSTPIRPMGPSRASSTGILNALGGVPGAPTKSKPAAKAQFWVNFRELSTRNEAKAELQTIADTIRQGGNVPLTGAKFNRMMRLLQGNAASLDSSSKQNLQVLFDYAVSRGNDRAQELLTEVRFGVPLDDEWSSNTARKDIPVLWRVLLQLPVSSVVGNVALTRLDLSGTGGGGVYDPDSGIVTIYGGTASATSAAGTESFEDTLRHEVGHAVHWRSKAAVDGWLRDQFGWEEFEARTQEILNWAGRMGSAAWPSGTSETLKREAAAVLANSLPQSGWNSGPIRDESASPAVRALLASDTCGVAKAWRATGDDWYDRCDQWFTANGKRFFVNFWYGTFMCVNTTTVDLILRMPSRYAAMSGPEFFAELYALWYDVDDPLRSRVPQAARTWFANNVG